MMLNTSLCSLQAVHVGGRINQGGEGGLQNIGGDCFGRAVYINLRIRSGLAIGSAPQVGALNLSTVKQKLRLIFASFRRNFFLQEMPSAVAVNLANNIL